MRSCAMQPNGAKPTMRYLRVEPDGANSYYAPPQGGTEVVPILVSMRTPRDRNDAKFYYALPKWTEVVLTPPRGPGRNAVSV